MYCLFFINVRACLIKTDQLFRFSTCQRYLRYKEKKKGLKNKARHPENISWGYDPSFTTSGVVGKTDQLFRFSTHLNYIKDKNEKKKMPEKQGRFCGNLFWDL